ncbi:hypothetical protein [Planosporangium mesophilum]|uniref:WD40 repeat domain-containing protein n=1 Tax=Planosporangium mesophilum TaxID=689768 RepID=A0A8J3WYK8_9ACTN|nr:hypothetical protein [Planosporangium mesophilum]NJC81663.1 hypothetical protein [Planosporangium mesophilum]GII20676.1 hypothetical protein Pme01_02730 [Planosporangium mesophilum]
MNSRLREAMREHAESVPAYRVDTAALAGAERRRRVRTAVAAAVVVVLVAVVPLAVRGLGVRTVPPASGPAVPSLPDRVAAPPLGTTGALSARPGPAAVLFGGNSRWQAKGEVIAVGASTDRYGVLASGHYNYAGEQALLSPDGGRVATPDGVHDLSSGRSQAWPALGGEFTIPAVWSPDGRWAAVIALVAPYDTRPGGVMVPTPRSAVLHLVDPATGEHHRIADLDPGSVVDGYVAAFAPDGGRLAYQSGTTVSVADLEGRVLNRFAAPPRTRLAGKGAWTPAGDALVLAEQRGCCPGEAYPSRWRLRVVEPATGADAARPALPELTGLVAVRLLGWSPRGEAVVAALYPEPGIKVVDFTTGAGALSGSHVGLTAYDWVRAVRVLACAPGARPRTLLTAPDQDVLSVDVASDVIAGGETRRGDPPGLPAVLGRFAVPALAGWLLLGALVCGVAAALSRRRYRRAGGWRR